MYKSATDRRKEKKYCHNNENCITPTGQDNNLSFITVLIQRVHR